MIRKGTVVKKKRGGGTRRAKVVAVSETHAKLRALAPSARKRSSRVYEWLVPLDESGNPDGYEVAT